MRVIGIVCAILCAVFVIEVTCVCFFRTDIELYGVSKRDAAAAISFVEVRENVRCVDGFVDWMPFAGGRRLTKVRIRERVNVFKDSNGTEHEGPCLFISGFIAGGDKNIPEIRYIAHENESGQVRCVELINP